MNLLKNKKILLLGATFSTSNMGVGALTAGTIKCVLHQFPGAEIFLLDYGKKKQTYNFQIDNKVIPIQLLNMRFSKKLYLKNNISVLLLLSLLLKLIPSQKIRNSIIFKNLYLKHIYESDIVASIAGGDSFSDIYGIRNFFYVSLPQVLILFMGKKLVLLPQTLGPFKGRLARVVAKYILNRANVVYSRDYTGIEEMRKFLSRRFNTSRIRFCYDVGFALDPVKPDNIDLGDLFEKRADNSSVVGLNISGLLFMGGYTQDNMFGLKIDYRKLIYTLIDRLMQKKNVMVILVPHVFGLPEHPESDSVICSKIYDELKTKYKDRLFLAQGHYNQNEIKYVIGLCNFFIGSRMHACIAALSQNIPAVTIAYSKKFFGVLQTIGVESLVADPRIMDKKEILSIIDNAYENRNSLKEKLQQTIPQVKETVLNLFSE
ncbi:MAG: polysaccharide pyruvyl transferase family protein [Deltaproteobacteria bacterium]|nr:polysaccharide pyruvyl transferase family protein [Deltaproteobacteria bacterium]